MRRATNTPFAFPFARFLRPGDRGSSMVEAAAAVALVAAIAVAVLAVAPDRVSGMVESAACAIEDCADESAPPGAGDDDGDSILPTATPSESPSSLRPRDTNDDRIVCVRAPCP